jgi:hypothetical protein
MNRLLFGIDLIQVNFQVSLSHSMSTCFLYDEEIVIFLSHTYEIRTREIIESLLFCVLSLIKDECKELLF